MGAMEGIDVREDQGGVKRRVEVFKDHQTSTAVSQHRDLAALCVSSPPRDDRLPSGHRTPILTTFSTQRAGHRCLDLPSERRGLETSRSPETKSERERKCQITGFLITSCSVFCREAKK
ncbi:hypothetical protein E1301_Tti015803 [Triplophysa tibetana]|uniref:Uncharacterized protein n=1 Tax=Triplophysa tibetana TaxID=1572043 RepID=A0A5A9P2I2_9TELE|nr:hypothetical protein E1301_Tti015803 [Triplophysa tibetana]